MKTFDLKDFKERFKDYKLEFSRSNRITAALTLNRASGLTQLVYDNGDELILNFNDIHNYTYQDNGIVRDVPYISYLPQHTLDTLASITITQSKIIAVGVCGWMTSYQGCNNVRVLYDAHMHDTYADRDVDLPGVCSECANAMLINSTYRTPPTYDQDGLRVINKIIPDSMFEEVEADLSTCAACDTDVLSQATFDAMLTYYEITPDSNVYVATHRWLRMLGTTGYAEGIHSNLHNMCAVACYNCEQKYSNKTSETVDVITNNGWQKVCCRNCVEVLWGSRADDIEDFWCEHGDHYAQQTQDEFRWSDYWDRDMCNYCYDMYVECNECGYEYHQDTGHDCEDEYDDDDSGLVHNYSYKPNPIFFGDSKYYFGIELEVESRASQKSEAAETVVNALSEHVYLKSDGSLANGFEIVTHPHSLDSFHELEWGWLDTIKSQGMRSWNTDSCGLHVHVSRSAFGPEGYQTNSNAMKYLHEAHLIRFNKFIYDNQIQVEILAGRKNNNYASFSDKGRVIPKVKLNRQSSGRYSAVNLENRTTVELRMFKGSLRKERVLSAVEFTHAVVEYTRNLKVQASKRPFAWSRFTTYVTNNEELYPNLFTIMSESFDRRENREDN